MSKPKKEIMYSKENGSEATIIVNEGFATVTQGNRVYVVREEKIKELFSEKEVDSKKETNPSNPPKDADPKKDLMKLTKDKLIALADEKGLSEDNDLTAMNKEPIVDLILSVEEE